MIDYCVRCGRIVDEKYDQMCYDLHGVCLCKECRIWARAVTPSAKAPHSEVTLPPTLSDHRSDYAYTEFGTC